MTGRLWKCVRCLAGLLLICALIFSLARVTPGDAIGSLSAWGNGGSAFYSGNLPADYSVELQMSCGSYSDIYAYARYSDAAWYQVEAGSFNSTALYAYDHSANEGEGATYTLGTAWFGYLSCSQPLRLTVHGSSIIVASGGQRVIAVDDYLTSSGTAGLQAYTVPATWTTAVIWPADTTPPSAPANLAAQGAGNRIDLSWSPSADAESGLWYYTVYRNSVYRATVGDAGFSDYSVQTGSTYTYVVTATDNEYNTSPASNSATITYSGSNPAPALNAISLASATAGSPALTLTVTGSNLVTGSVVRWNGSSRTTTYVSSTQLTAAITAADLASPGAAAVTVFNPAPGGGTSGSAAFTISNPGGNPVPSVTTISPASAAAGSPAFTLTVNGSGFVAGSVVQWNGSTRTTSYVSSTQLTAAIAAADVASPGAAAVTVFNPAPGGGTSGGAAFTVTAPPVSPIGSVSAWGNWGSSFYSGSLPGDYSVELQMSCGSYADIYAYARYSDAAWYQVEAGSFNWTALYAYDHSANDGEGAQYTLGTAGLDYATCSQPVRLTVLGTSIFVTSAGAQVISTDDSLTSSGTAGLQAYTVPATWTTAVIWPADAPPPPPPVVAAISPGFVAVGSPAFMLTVTGSNFVSWSVVQWNGSNRTTTYVSSTELRASINAADVAVAGSAQVRVFNAAPGGGLSTAITFNVVNPAPAISSLSPPSIAAGSPAFTLIVNGSNFVTASVVRWKGSDRPTTYLSSQQLMGGITAADVASVGTATVTVFNPAPGGGTSGGAAFTISNPGGNPVPTLSTISPTSAAAGSPAFTLTVNGSNFLTSSVVQWNGANRATTYVNGSQLTATIAAGDVASVGTATVAVFTPAPGGGTSSPLTFTITTNPLPVVAGISPSSVTPGSAAFTLTVNGSSFVTTSVVQWNGSSRTTTFGGSTQLSTQISAADVAAPGTATVTVLNPTPGGGTSNGLSFTIDVAGPGIAPAVLEVNLGFVPIDLYQAANNQPDKPGTRFWSNSKCQLTDSIRGCVQKMFRSDTNGYTPDPDNFRGQGVSGVRFFFGINGPLYSTPFDLSEDNGNYLGIRQQWRDNLRLFFSDLHQYGIARVTPTISLTAEAVLDCKIGGCVPGNKVIKPSCIARSAIPITAATNSNRAELTSSGHGLVDGSPVTISGATGSWAAINGYFEGEQVEKVDDNRFRITAVDSTSFGALTGSPVFDAPCAFPVMNSACGRTEPMFFIRTAPFGYNATTSYPAGQQRNDAYDCATAAGSLEIDQGHRFWGWGPYLAVVDELLAAAAASGLQVEDFDILNEINLTQFTVAGRLLWDNKHDINGTVIDAYWKGTDVLQKIRDKMTAHVFNYLHATFSTTMGQPTVVNGFDCGSVYGDSAMILHESALTAAISGGYIGWPPGAAITYNLFCGGGVFKNPNGNPLDPAADMYQFPVAWGQPAVTNVHAYACMSDGAGGCVDPETFAPSDRGLTPRTFYGQLYSAAAAPNCQPGTDPNCKYLNWRQKTGDRLVFGEVFPADGSCTATDPAWATLNVAAFAASDLKQRVQGAGTVFRVWTNPGLDCWGVPSRLVPPYDPNR